jgi:hypothetical protein
VGSRERGECGDFCTWVVRWTGAFAWKVPIMASYRRVRQNRWPLWCSCCKDDKVEQAYRGTKDV